MAQSFSFSFAGDDIEVDAEGSSPILSPSSPVPPFRAAETGSLRRPTDSKISTAFPICGQTLLPPLKHDIEGLLYSIPSKISYSTLAVRLDDGEILQIPRREWWDVRVQIMAEEHIEAAAEVGLGREDVKTGVYEGGFKSWESSVDLVKVLASRKRTRSDVDDKEKGISMTVLEMGCGTALPSLALLQWCLKEAETEPSSSLRLAFSDYNPSVLQLVTVPNVLLTWAQSRSMSDPASSWAPEGELDISPELLQDFIQDLSQRHISLSFFSGAWSPEFVELVTPPPPTHSSDLPFLVLAAETIYSPFALKSFTDSLVAILCAEKEIRHATALVAAKKIYFGVGGSIEDFVDEVTRRGARVERIREEEEGVRRSVVEVMRAEK